MKLLEATAWALLVFYSDLGVVKHAGGDFETKEQCIQDWKDSIAPCLKKDADRERQRVKEGKKPIFTGSVSALCVLGVYLNTPGVTFPETKEESKCD